MGVVEEVATLLRTTKSGVPERLKTIVKNNRQNNAVTQSIVTNSKNIILNHNVELFKYILSLPDIHNETEIVLFLKFSRI